MNDNKRSFQRSQPDRKRSIPRTDGTAAVIGSFVQRRLS
jgi:hypothetical protein